MSFNDLVRSIRKGWILIAALTCVSTVAFGFFSMRATPVYTAEASLYVSISSGQTATELNQGATYTRDQMLSFAQLAEMPVVLDPVIRGLNLDESPERLDDRIEIEVPQDTSILAISVTDPSASQAAAIANDVTTGLSELVTELAPRNAQGDSTVNARVVKVAKVPTVQSAPNTKRNVLAGFGIGLVGGVAIAFARDLLDTRVRSSSAAERYSGAPVLAKLSRQSRKERLGTLWDDTARTEELRKFRTTLEYLTTEDETLCIVFSSSVAAEGKSTACTGLAQVLAQAGHSTLIIDADLRRPSVAQGFGMIAEAGLTSVLLNKARFDDVVQKLSPRLDILASGVTPPNPAELLSSPSMQELVDMVRERYDIVLLDTPPLLPVADAAILSRITSGVVLVVDVRRTSQSQVEESAGLVRSAGGRVRGVVLNHVRKGGRNSYEYARVSLDTDMIPVASRG
ncbi:polysaccharide biosynthesis tyrosine autokinase [Promicromonospora iranensis]|uniref:non-specific protein-tyrosine kinase n=1 Tax=Promicromonospora iranensis TaxID=1105144 RepID=A0ABU2CM88_9MICO|nr:polysaccharide biosynthesis tyrosine autokinase [Promicromonospora iranensis]MDR7382449.1 capsular exopolysaccharide synthesis family protein [Promicromonospora iranensis]